MPEFRPVLFAACLLGILAAPCHGASTEELRVRCTDLADYERIHPDEAADYINACVQRLEKGGVARGPASGRDERRAPIGYDGDL